MVNDFALSLADAAGIVAGWNQAANSPPLDEKELAAVMANAAKYAKKATGHKATATLRRPPSKDEIKNTVGKVSELRDEFQREERGERKSVSLPWEALQENSALLRPGTVAILGGPAGFGKSFLALELLAHVHRIGVPWSLLPLEDRRVDVQRRLLAHLERDWSVIDDSPETAQNRIEFLARHELKLDEMARHVTENPRLPVDNGSGKKVVPNLPYPEVL
jgi:ABC-type glutathione transport system ATPase component